MSPTIFPIDWSAIASNGIFAVLFTGLLIYVMRSNERRENIMRSSFVQRENKFMELEGDFIKGLHENTNAIVKLTDLIGNKLDEMKERIEEQGRYPVHVKKGA